jgi:hypothetical protein
MNKIVIKSRFKPTILVEKVTGGSGGVTSVNGQTGDVVLDASDVGADPSGSANQALSDANDYTDNAISSIDFPVDSVNGLTGVVVLNASDVGADPSGSANQALLDANDYTDNAINTIDFPVDSVNGLTGVVVLNASDVGADPSGSANQALLDANDYTDNAISSIVFPVDSVNGLTGVVVLDSDDISVPSWDGTSGIVTDALNELYNKGGSVDFEIVSLTTTTTIDDTYAGKVIECNGTFTVTLPNSMNLGMNVTIINIGTGVITIAASGTLQSKASYNKITVQYAGATAYHRGSNIWLLAGDINN